MKIFYLTTDTKIGGTERMLLTLLKGIDRSKHELFLCALKSGGPLIEEAGKLGVRGVCTKNLFTIFKLFKKESPEILHTFLFHSNILGRILGRVAGVPVIISSQRSIDKWRKPWHTLLDRWTSGLCNLIISNSEGGRKILIEREKISLEKIITIHNGIETDKFTEISDPLPVKKSFGFNENDFVIGIVANLREVKGHKYLFEAFRLLKESQKNKQLKLFVVGEGKLGNDLLLLAKNLGIEKDVTFTGFRNDISEILKIIDIFVLPSLWEGFPVSILEAMASSKPVIASDVGGISEAVVDGQTGFLVEPKNSKSLFQSIAKLIEDKNLASRMSQAGKERVEQFFTSNKMIRKTEEVYDGFRKDAKR